MSNNPNNWINKRIIRDYSSVRGDCDMMAADDKYRKTGRRSTAGAGSRRSRHRHVAAIVTSTDGHRKTPAPLAQSTPSRPRIRPASDAHSVATENAINATRVMRRLPSGSIGSLKVTAAAQSVRRKLT